MRLQYTGSKPLISAKGIQFDRKKKDKYVYLSFVTELIKALDHAYSEEKRYSYTISSQLNECDEFLSFMKSRDCSIIEDITFHKERIERELEREIQHVRENCLLCEEEKDTFVNNLTLMQKYRLQRSINKAAYYSGINYLAQIIHRERIAFITAPIFPMYFHIFHSIQGALAKLHPPMDSTIEIYEEKAQLHARLNIKY